MWTLRFLNGQWAGRTIPLQNGSYLMGRSEECQITLKEAGVSKKHLELEVHSSGVRVIDLKSSNGTFVNGIKVQENDIQVGDKISLCKIIFDIIPFEGKTLPPPAPHGLENPPAAGGGGLPPAALQHGGAGAAFLPQAGLSPDVPGGEGGHLNMPPSPPENPPPQSLTLKNWFNNYLEKVVLPGIYKLPEWVEFHWVIAGFLIFFVFTITSLSAIPLISILNDSVEQESLSHAESIATTLAQINREPVQNKMFSATSVEYAQRRPGVSKAFILNAVDGRVIAPPEKAYTYPKEPFFNAGRRKNRISVKKISPGTVGAMVPIQFYNTKTDTHSAYAYAAILYDMGTLSVGNKRTVSLLVWVFFLAMVLGTLLFFFMYKMIRYPIVSINEQLSQALKDETVNVQTTYEFEPLKNLANNINATLSRVASAREDEVALTEYDRSTEMTHLVEMIGYPTLGVNMERMNIEVVSAHFEEETGVSAERIQNRMISDIEDQALKLNLETLVDKVSKHPHEVASDSLEFSGVEFQLSAKGIYGKDKLAYTLITFIPTQGSEEQS